MSNCFGGGVLTGAVCALCFRKLIAASHSSLSLMSSSGGFCFGFSIGLDSSGGNIHSGCWRSGAFFFFFLFGCCDFEPPLGGCDCSLGGSDTMMKSGKLICAVEVSKSLTFCMTPVHCVTSAAGRGISVPLRGLSLSHPLAGSQPS